MIRVETFCWSSAGVSPPRKARPAPGSEPCAAAGNARWSWTSSIEEKRREKVTSAKFGDNAVFR